MRRFTSFGIAAVAFGLVCLAAATPARAQEGDDTLTPLPTAGLIAKLGGSERWVGIHVMGNPIGAMHAKIEATAGGVKFTWKGSMAMGPKSVEIDGMLESNADLRLLAYEETQVEAGKWRRSVVASGTTGLVYTRTTRPSDQPDAEPEIEEKPFEEAGIITEVPLLMLMCGALDIPVDASHSVGLFDSATGAVNEGRVTRKADAEIDHGGAKATARVFEIVETTSGKTSEVFIVDGKFARSVLAGTPLSMVGAATKEAATASTKAPESAAEKAVRDAAVRYLRGNMLGDKKLVESTMDFAALQKRMAKSAPEVDALKEEAFRDLILGEIEANAGAIPKAEAEEQLALVAGMLEIEVEGDDAKVGLPGEDAPMEFRKNAAGEWRLVWWDAFNR